MQIALPGRPYIVLRQGRRLGRYQVAPPRGREWISRLVPVLVIMRSQYFNGPRRSPDERRSCRVGPSHLSPVTVSNLKLPTNHPRSPLCSTYRVPTGSHRTATHITTLSSSFQLSLNNVLNAYERRTQKDLLAHPPTLQRQTCDFPSAVLVMIQQ